MRMSITQGTCRVQTWLQNKLWQFSSSNKLHCRQGISSEQCLQMCDSNDKIMTWQHIYSAYPENLENTVTGVVEV